jgi:hypothetical protein
MSTSGIVGVVAVLGLGGGVAALFAQNRALERRLAEVEAARTAVAVEASRRSDAAAESGPSLRGIDETTAQVRSLQASVQDLGQRLAKQEERAKVQAASGAAGGKFVPNPDDPVFEEAVRGVVEKLLVDDTMKPKFAMAVKGEDVPKKPHIDVLTRALALDGNQDRRFREDLKDIQTQLFAILSEERADGIVPIAEIQKAEALPEGDPARFDMFMKLIKLQIPGSQQTYFEKAVELAGDFRKKTAEYFRPEQTDRFGKMDLDLFGIRFE